MTTLTLISLFAIGVIAIVFNKKLKRTRYESDLYRNKLLIEQKNYTILETSFNDLMKSFVSKEKFIEDLLSEDKRKSGKILLKNQEIENLKKQVK